MSDLKIVQGKVLDPKLGQILTHCECDNSHQQNDSVCRYCWAHGRRHWNDPEVNDVYLLVDDRDFTETDLYAGVAYGCGIYNAITDELWERHYAASEQEAEDLARKEALACDFNIVTKEHQDG